MRIAVWHNLPNGGGKRALYDHVRGLVSRGHTVESWCPPATDQPYLPLSRLVPEHTVPLDWSPKSFPLTRSYGSALDRLRALDRHCRLCGDEISRGGFDLLFANASSLVAVSPIARYVGIPAVLYLGEPYRMLYEALPRLPWAALETPKNWWHSAGYLKKRAADVLRVRGMRVQAREEVLNARAFVSVLVNSYYSRESVLRTYGLDAKVCYLGIDTQLFVNRSEPRERLVVSLGHFAFHKNIHFLIRALAEVKQPRPRLLCIGNLADTAYLEDLKRLAASAGVAFEAKLRVSDAELVSILNVASMMVYAPRLEPFGFAPLEGNACGLPVIAVPEGGVRETIIHGVNGVHVEHDPKAMAAAIQDLLDHPAVARQLGENGCKLVADRWTLEQSADRLEQRLGAAIEESTEKTRSSEADWPSSEVLASSL